jgi:hypothetical protein
MGIHPDHLLEHVIRPVLAKLPEPMRGRAAERLLLGTAMHEGDGASALAQYHGPALGIYQMEPPTYRAVMDWLAGHVELAHRVFRFSLPGGEVEQLAGNLYYGTAIARIYYYMHPHALPEADDLPGLAAYWHKAWCRGCRGAPADFLASWHRHVGTRLTQ